MTFLTHNANDLHRRLRARNVDDLQVSQEGDFVVFSYRLPTTDVSMEVDLGTTLLSSPKTAQAVGLKAYDGVDVENSRPVFAIGDVHGHLDRIEALLSSQKLIQRCPDCRNLNCPTCEGSGYLRSPLEATIVQLGDLGHIGETGSATGDIFCYNLAKSVFDVLLWGNHDRAAVDPHHQFGGFKLDNIDLFRAVVDTPHKMAFLAHGFLLTHAGLQRGLARLNVAPTHRTPRGFSEIVNRLDGQYAQELEALNINADELLKLRKFRDDISVYRGGPSTTGGILWRDTNESLYRVPQIFGHSKGEKIRRYTSKAGDSYCIDLGTEANGRLAGVWLPEMRFVEVIHGRLTSPSGKVKGA